MPIGDFSKELQAQIGRAERQGRPHVEINAGELHRVIGGYPNGGAHQMPSCCEALLAAKRAGDLVVFQPPEGKGASLTIRYILPRP